ncbi:peptidoglycan editing factor PgeF [Actinophytocola glycyrrhizae]|uniref:Purine nucleoside phosphorylase n=1 Tax=Actinophytocola glycyrrhizae TaxID=2044873 RepID=A0ABV9S606_9PSEU
MHIRRVVTTRAGGRSKPPYESFNLGGGVGDDPVAVAANRARLADELGLGRDRLVWMEQVHGRNAEVVDGPRAAAVEATDAIVTAEPNLALVALCADCVPVLLADPEAGVVGAAHAGRVGARVGVIPAALTAMEKAGASIDRVEVLLGPAACGECYEVPAAMQADVEAHLPGSASKTRKGTPGLDIRAGLWQQLADAGVAKIGIDPRCTIEDKTLFSHRREGTTGRLAALTWLDPADAS